MLTAKTRTMAQDLVNALEWRRYTSDTRIDAGANTKGIYFARTKNPPMVVYVGVADAGNTVGKRLRDHFTVQTRVTQAEHKMRAAAAEENLEYAYLNFHGGSPTAAEAYYIGLFGGPGVLWNHSTTNRTDLARLKKALDGDRCPICDQSLVGNSDADGGVLLDLDIVESVVLKQTARSQTERLPWHIYQKTTTGVAIDPHAAAPGIYFIRTRAPPKVVYVGIADAGQSMEKRLVTHLTKGRSPADQKMQAAPSGSLEYAVIVFATGSPKAAEAYYIEAFGGTGRLWNSRHTGQGHLASLARLLKSEKCPVCDQAF